MGKLQLIDFLKEDLRQLRKELEEFQENQIKALEELSKIENLRELESELEAINYEFMDECEGLLKEVIYVNKKIFENMVDKIWEEANERAAGGEATNV